MRTLNDYIQKAKALPPAPHILTELLPLLGDHDVDSSRIVDLITFDPALTAKVLQRCNSADSGAFQRVHDLQDAVTRLGFNEIYRLVAVVVGKGMLGSEQHGYGMAAGDLWRHSAVSAVAGKVLARTLGGDENIIFTAALLHDIGKLILNTSVAEEYQTLIGEIRQSGNSFLQAEKSVLGVDHAELGGRMLEIWNFPESLIAAVKHHHDPIQAHPHEQLAAYVHMSDMLAHIMGHGEGFMSYAVYARPEAFEILEISPREIEELVIKTDAILNEANCLSPLVNAP